MFLLFVGAILSAVHCNKILVIKNNNIITQMKYQTRYLFCKMRRGSTCWHLNFARFAVIRLRANCNQHVTKTRFGTQVKVVWDNLCSGGNRTPCCGLQKLFKTQHCLTLSAFACAVVQVVLRQPSRKIIYSPIVCGYSIVYLTGICAKMIVD